MSYICPLCNGLAELTATCPDCGHVMEDAGMRRDYIGPYSPYGSADAYTAVYSRQISSGCEHVVLCPHCHEGFIYHVNAWRAP